jgi:hypothetical protein
MTPQFRITVTLDETLFQDIAELAAKDNRKVASMAAILLARQVKETNRKKKPNERTPVDNS